MKASGSDNGRKQGFDWEFVRQRIAVANAALAESSETAPEVLQQVWAQRAVQLAQVPVQEDEGEQIELVLIQLGRETYGLEAQYVFDIRTAVQIIRVPRVPEWVAGIVNLRGRILSVLDLQRFFGLPRIEGNGDDGSTPMEAMPYLVVVGTPDIEISLLTDDVLAVEALPASRVQDAAAIVRGIRPDYVRGVVERTTDTPTDGDDPTLVTVLNVPALLADERLIVYRKV